MAHTRGGRALGSGLLLWCVACGQASAQPLVYVAGDSSYTLALTQSLGSIIVLDAPFTFDGVDEPVTLGNGVQAVVSESEIDLGNGGSRITAQVFASGEIFSAQFSSFQHCFGFQNPLETGIPVDYLGGTLSILGANAETLIEYSIGPGMRSPWDGTSPGLNVLEGLPLPDGTFGVRWTFVVEPSDSDNDGVIDAEDICPGSDDGIDSDADGVPDGCDACPGSDDSQDIDNDGIPNDCDKLCEADVFPDGVFDINDVFYMYTRIYNLGVNPYPQFDLDRSGAFDFLDWLELVDGCE